MKRDQTIGQLGRQYNLSRSTLLYYDRLGLLRPRNRSTSNYRIYSPADAERLRQICLFRRLGIPLKEIARVLDGAQSTGQTASLLRRRLETLATEIAAREEQQRQIVRLLSQFSARKVPRKRAAAAPKDVRVNGVSSTSSQHKESNVVNKQRWVEIMRAAGFNDDAMRAWHQHFEQMEPAAHQEFLESLGISAAEIARIRKSAASG